MTVRAKNDGPGGTWNITGARSGLSFRFFEVPVFCPTAERNGIVTAFFKTSLMMKFVILFLLVALIPIALVGYFSYSSAERALFSSGVEKLAGAGEDRKLDLMTYVRGCLDDALFLSFIPSVKFAFEVVESSRGAGKSGRGDEAVNPTDLYDRTATQAGELLSAWQKVVASKKGYLDLLIVTTDGRTA
jgi:hypothetical protein